MGRCMDEWMGKWMDECMDGWMDGLLASLGIVYNNQKVVMIRSQNFTKQKLCEVIDFSWTLIILTFKLKYF